MLEYDLRNTTGPIVTSPTRDLSQILQNQDEVNQLAIRTYYNKPKQPSKKKGKSNKRVSASGAGAGADGYRSNATAELWIAAADDAGTIRFMESQSSQSQILHHDPNGVAVVPTCAFRPSMGTTWNKGSSSLELASGGTDCKIHLWDLLKPK